MITIEAGRDAAAKAPRQRFWRLSVRSKFLIMMLLTSLISLGTITYMTFHSGRKAISDAALNQLTSVRVAKKQHIATFFRTTRTTFRAFADIPDTAMALEELATGFRTLGGDPLTTERRKALERFYTADFLPRIAKTRDSAPTIDDYMPFRAEGIDLQALFIAENADKVGEKSKLTRHTTQNAYTAAHARHHRWLSAMADQLNLYDVFLIDADGNVVYTVQKEPDLGQNVISGPLASTKMAQLVRAVATSRQPDEARYTDFAFYWPSGNVPAAFLAAPLFREGRFIGTIVAQVPTDEINTIMNDGGRWREQGLGRTGAVYLVGPDEMMRTNYRFLIENPEGFIGGVEKSGVVTPAVAKRLREQRSTVLNYPIFNSPLLKGFQGRSGTEHFTNQRGLGAFMSYSPLDVPDLNWVVAARMDDSEVLASQIAFGRNVMIVACIIALLVTLAALWLAGIFLRPISALLHGIERLRKGERGVTVATRSNDEFNDLVRSFNSMSETIQSRDEVIEGKTRAYEQLLRRIFPDAVADRMRQGEAGMVESYQTVTVIYAIIEGFTEVAGSHSAEDSGLILSDIVDRMDGVAEELGVEKVKTIGDHYLAISGLSVARLDSARRAIDFARHAARELQRINRERGLSLGLRIGIATGPVQVGLVGSRRFVFDVWGYAASAARRIVYDADVDTARINHAALEQLADRTGIDGELTVQMKSLGPVKTYQVQLAAADAVPAA